MVKLADVVALKKKYKVSLRSCPSLDLLIVRLVGDMLFPRVPPSVTHILQALHNWMLGDGSGLDGGVVWRGEWSGRRSGLGMKPLCSYRV